MDEELLEAARKLTAAGYLVLDNAEESANASNWVDLWPAHEKGGLPATVQLDGMFDLVDGLYPDWVKDHK
jgi:hypothetical protein